MENRSGRNGLVRRKICIYTFIAKLMFILLESFAIYKESGV